MKNKSEQLDANKSCEYKEIFDKADKFVEDDEFEKALDILDEIPNDCPEYADALFLKSMIVGRQGDMEKSFRLFQKFLAEEVGEDKVNMDEEYRPIDMENPDDLFYCGLTDFHIFKNYEGAIEYFNKSLRLKPNQAKVLHYKSLSFAYLGWFKKAVKIMDKAIAIEPENVRYLNDRGVLLVELGHIAKAHNSFDDAIAVEPNSCSLSNKGILYLNGDQFDNALDCFDNAIKLDSSDIVPIVGKIAVYMALEDFENADKYFAIAEKMDSDNVEYLSLRGKYLLDKSEFKKSIEFFDRCLEIDDELAFVWMYKSMALSELGCDFQSEECFKIAIDLDPNSIKVFDDVLIIED